jgi:hypothetical protein
MPLTVGELQALLRIDDSGVNSAIDQAMAGLRTLDKTWTAQVTVDDSAAMSGVEVVEGALTGIDDESVAIIGDAAPALAEIAMVTDASNIPDATVALLGDGSDAFAEAESVRMALDIPDEAVALRVDASEARSEIAGAKEALGGLAGAATGVLAGLGLQQVTMDAATLNDTINGTNVVFRDAADPIQEFGEAAASALGISHQETLQYSNALGTLLSGLGYSAQESANVTIEAFTRANDVSSATGIERTRVIEALISAYAGERESIKSIIGAISEEDVARQAQIMGLGQLEQDTVKAETARIRLAKAERALAEKRRDGKSTALDLREAENAVAQAAAGVEKALSGGTAELSAQDKAMATHALIMEKSALFQGDFNRTQEEGLNVVARAGATWSGLTTELGQSFVPVLEKLAQAAMPVMEWVMGLPGPLQAVIAGVALLVPLVLGFATAVGPLVMLLGPMGLGLFGVGAGGAAAAGGLGAAAAGLLGVLAPVLAVVGVIGVLVGIGYLLVQNWDTIKDVASDVWGFVTDVISTAAGWVGNNIGDMISFFSDLGTGIQYHVGQAIDFIAGIPGAIGDVFSGAGSWLLNAGQDIITGLWNGFAGATDWLFRQITGFVDDVIGWVTSGFGIFSPSKVFRERGRQLPAGLALGIMDNMPMVEDAIGSMVRLPEMSVPVPAGAGAHMGSMANGGSGEPPIVVNVAGNVVTTRDIARDVQAYLGERR